VCNGELRDQIQNKSHNGAEKKELMGKIEDAYKLYKLSEVFLKDVIDDYGKLKIARIRLEFARYELMRLLEEAREKGIKLDSSNPAREFFFPSS